jgi:hypothetical protein
VPTSLLMILLLNYDLNFLNVAKLVSKTDVRR